MDHEQAVQIGAVEKYLLDELSADEAEEFEAHFFDCVQCATELRATAQFLDRAKTELKRNRNQRNVKNAKGFGRSWLDFLRNPALLAPGMAVILAVVAYQNLSVYPRLVRELASQKQPQILQPLSLIGAGSRGGARPPAILGVHEDLMLSLDIPTSDDSSGYTCLLLSESGRVLWRLPISSAQARDTVHIRVPGGDLVSGQYVLVVQRRHGPNDSDELTRYPFNIIRAN